MERKVRGKTRGVLVKFVRHKSKMNVMKGKKHGRKIKIGKDLVSGTREMLNEIHRKKMQINVEKCWTIDSRIKYKLVSSDI